MVRSVTARALPPHGSGAAIGDDLEAMKAQAASRVERERARLLSVSHRIHARPELAFEEHFASELLAHELSDLGYAVRMGICDLPTAFTARRGDGALHVALIAEYDALPAIGHACGHNLIAACALGAAAGVAGLADELGCTISVIGCPAEERGAGKALLLKGGAFAGVHAALMVHPGPFDVARPVTAAMAELSVRAIGRATHAGAAPHLGVNAADALVLAQSAIGLLRQHLPPGDVVHGVVTSAGVAANVIPELATASYVVRSTDGARRDRLQGRVSRCFHAGGLATGARVSVEIESPALDAVRHDEDLIAAYEANARAGGRTFSPAIPVPISTDMGNVSQVVPVIHPILGIESWPAVNHQPEFAAACVAPAADRAVIDGAIALAATVIDAAGVPRIRDRLTIRAQPNPQDRGSLAA
jgi:amidohydrolase